MRQMMWGRLFSYLIFASVSLTVLLILKRDTCPTDNEYRNLPVSLQTNSKNTLPLQPPPISFPQTERQIPSIIIQTWKHNNKNHIADDVRWNHWFKSWDTKNPGYLHVLMDDREASQFVLSRFPGRIARAYFKLPLVVQRTDLLRYLMLWYFGGVYTDMDTSCLKPIDEWAPADSKFIAGLEWTKGFMDYEVQACQWTFASAPRHPIMTNLIHTLTETIHSTSNETLYSNQQDTLVGLTGPIPFTKAILSYIESVQPGSTSLIEKMVSGYEVIGDVTILGVSAFAPSNPLAKGFSDPEACVRHEYTGEWGDGWKKKKHFAKEQHP